MVVIAATSWSQGGPPPRGQEGPPPGGQEQPQEGQGIVGLSDAFANIEPTVADRGQLLTLKFSFRTGVQAPPETVNPAGASLGGVGANTVVRANDGFTAAFSIGANVALGEATLAVEFPTPNGAVTFEQAAAVTIQETSQEPEVEVVNEPISDPIPVPVPIDEPPVPGTLEEEGETGLETSSVTAASLSVRAADEGGALFVTVNGDPGTSWQLQVTSDLSSWSDFATVELGANGMGVAELSSLEGSRSFVRGRSTAAAIETPEEPTDVVVVTDVYTLFSDNVEVFEDGENIVLRSTGVPNHSSPYFGIGDPLYEAYNGDNTRFHQNPNGIAEQELVFRVPKNPMVAANHEATPLGPIGIAINGVAFFNQYAGPNNQPLTNEIDSFDQYGGHPAQRDFYHYHIEPLFLSGQVGRDGFLGVLRDGYPVYGPEENGVEITNADLDEFHGHFSATKDHPEGIYHYHFTSEDPYLNGSGYYGAKGSVTQ